MPSCKELCENHVYPNRRLTVEALIRPMQPSDQALFSLSLDHLQTNYLLLKHCSETDILL